jgi:hypothetical protein
VVTSAATSKRLAAPERRIGWLARPHAWLEWSTRAKLFELARLGCAAEGLGREHQLMSAITRRARLSRCKA